VSYISISGNVRFHLIRITPPRYDQLNKSAVALLGFLYLLNLIQVNAFT
jgi:hypothetical protein